MVALWCYSAAMSGHRGKRPGVGAKPKLSREEQAEAVADCERESQLWSAAAVWRQRERGLNWAAKADRKGNKWRGKKIRNYRVKLKRQKGHRDEIIRKVAKSWGITPRTMTRYWTNARASNQT
jgi:hypothetical protein